MPMDLKQHSEGDSSLRPMYLYRDGVKALAYYSALGLIGVNLLMLNSAGIVLRFFCRPRFSQRVLRRWTLRSLRRVRTWMQWTGAGVFSYEGIHDMGPTTKGTLFIANLPFFFRFLKGAVMKAQDGESAREFMQRAEAYFRGELQTLTAHQEGTSRTGTLDRPRSPRSGEAH